MAITAGPEFVFQPLTTRYVAIFKNAFFHSPQLDITIL